MPPQRNNGLERWRGEVTATLKDIGDRLSELGERFEKALTSHVVEDRSEFDCLDERMKKVETTQATLATKVAIAAGIIGTVAAVIAEVAIKKFVG